MATRTFDVEATVAASPEEAIGFLCELDRHYGLHTYVEKAVRESQGTDADGDWVQWRVTERPSLGPLRYTIHFLSRATRTSATSMRGDVEPAPGCRLVITTTASVTDAGTLVAETVTVSAPRPLVGYMTRHALIAHAHLFELLPEELGRPTR